MFDSLDHYLSIFREGGLDRENLDDRGRPRRIPLRNFLEAGQAQLREVTSGPDKITWRDAISTPDIAPWLPQVITRNVIEAQEPLLVLTNLFERMDYQAGQAIEFPAVGGAVAADIAEGESYPEIRLNESGATSTAKAGKSGVAFRITDEALQDSRYDLMGMHLRACARALARHKEVKAANFLTSLGTVCFDNITPTSSFFGVTQGRALNGAANGSMTLDDLFDTMSQVMMQGFQPDTLIMHPLTFILFLKDPDLRTVMLAGGNRVWYGGWSGNPAMAGQGSRTHTSGGQAVTPGSAVSGAAASGVNAYNQGLDSAPLLPGHWPWPLKIVVSPWIPYDPATKRTDIVCANSSEIGFYIVNWDTKVDKWVDLSTDTQKVKLSESYAFHIANEGLGIGVMKNVKVIANAVSLPARATHSVSGTIDIINPATPV